METIDLSEFHKWHKENIDIHGTFLKEDFKRCWIAAIGSKKTPKSSGERICMCGCGESIAKKHPNAKFLNSRHKDRYHNRINPRGYFAESGTIDEYTWNNLHDDHPFSSEALGQE